MIGFIKSQVELLDKAPGLKVHQGRRRIERRTCTKLD